MIRPRAMVVQMSAYIGHQVTPAFPFVIACDFVMRVTEGAFDGVGPRAVRGQPQHLEARMSRQPLPHRLCFVNTIVIRHDVDPVVALRRIAALEQVK